MQSAILSPARVDSIRQENVPLSTMKGQYASLSPSGHTSRQSHNMFSPSITDTVSSRLQPRSSSGSSYKGYFDSTQSPYVDMEARIERDRLHYSSSRDTETRMRRELEESKVSNNLFDYDYPSLY
jgi:hypothetical protein